MLSDAGWGRAASDLFYSVHLVTAQLDWDRENFKAGSWAFLPATLWGVCVLVH